MITHTVACPHTSLARTDDHRSPGATRSMNIFDWTGQEKGEAEGLSDKNGVIYAAQEVQHSLWLRPPQ